MGAPSPELCNLWLARAFNAQDVEAAAAMYHPDASIVQVDEVHGGTKAAGSMQRKRQPQVVPVIHERFCSMDGSCSHASAAGENPMSFARLITLPSSMRAT